MKKVSGAVTVLDSSKDSHRLEAFLRYRPNSWAVIHLIRDPRAFVASQQRRKGRAEWPTERCIELWLREHEQQRRVLTLVDRNRLICVKYEDLCRSTDRILRQICGVLEIEYQSEMLNYPGKVHHDIRGNAMRWSPKKVSLDEVWRESLGHRELNIVGRKAGRIMETLGYV